MFLSLKMIYGHLLSLYLQNGCCSPFYMSRVSCSNSHDRVILLQRKLILMFFAASKLAFAALRVVFAAVSTPYLDSSDYIHFEVF